MNREKITLSPLVFDDIGLSSAAKKVLLFAQNKESALIVTPNGVMAKHAMESLSFCTVLQKASLTLPDGVGVTLAARLMQTPFQNGRVTGVSLGIEVARLAAQEGLSVFFLGGRPGVAQKAASNLKKRYPTLQIAGVSHGYRNDVRTLTEHIKQSGASILFCCLGSPRQEFLAATFSQNLSCPILCLGGSLDVYAEISKRAPLFWQTIGCEWLWRTLQEPSRINRLPALFSFSLIFLQRSAKKLLQS